MIHLTFLTSAACALALAACSSEDVENTAIDDIDELVDDDVNYAYPVGGELNEQQLANFDAMDRQAASDEYDENREAIMARAPADGGDGEAASGSSDSAPAMETTAGASASDSSMSSDKSSAMPQRGQMDFAWLDRNGDGQLSVAEYAIWALPTDPAAPEPNDAKPPYLTPDQINEAGQTFFYFDDDGDTYLSASEFQDARNSARAPT